MKYWIDQFEYDGSGFLIVGWGLPEIPENRLEVALYKGDEKQDTEIGYKIRDDVAETFYQKKVSVPLGFFLTVPDDKELSDYWLRFSSPELSSDRTEFRLKLSEAKKKYQKEKSGFRLFR